MAKKNQQERKTKSSISAKMVHTSEERRAIGTATKANTIHELLNRTKGASIDELAAASGWQSHSVRGYISGTIKKRLGLKISSTVVDETRYYHITCTGAALRAKQRKSSRLRRVPEPRGVSEGAALI